jgi:hypothetical protein
MFACQLRSTAAALIILAVTPGCASVPVKLPAIKSQLQLASAGHTGCLPSDNDISNANVDMSGVGTWNATCKGRVYLCAAVSSGNQAFEYSCAPLAQ